MLKILGSASSSATTQSVADVRIDHDADRGLGVAGAAAPQPDSDLRRESTSGVEWLPRHLPHRRI
jgi:hypothetical protein